MVEATMENYTYQRFFAHKGRFYQDVLRAIHQQMEPKNYLEVGVNTGETLAIASCPSIGVDPNFLIAADVVGKKPRLSMYRETSDDFFAKVDVKDVLGGPVDFAFLDGLHLCEFLLRDFMNTEKVAAKGSIIVLHDCLPLDVPMARRDQYDAEIRNQTPTPGKWTGDVWKSVAILKKYRPDLEIHALNAPPTGLVLITNLNPKSTVLFDRYDEFEQEMFDMASDNETMSAYIQSMNVAHMELKGRLAYLTDVIDKRHKPAGKAKAKTVAAAAH